jgi:hypothetical protein
VKMLTLYVCGLLVGTGLLWVGHRMEQDAKRMEAEFLEEIRKYALEFRKKYPEADWDRGQR